jgi:hypothetical protein
MFHVVVDQPSLAILVLEQVQKQQLDLFLDLRDRKLVDHHLRAIDLR